MTHDPSASRVTLSAGRLLIDGEPQIVLAGEVHYFRVPPEQWADRLDALIEAGCNAVASYVPWLVHELPDGSIDVTGQTLPDRDVAAFIDLAAERGLWFLARPGPFIMAELMDEGIPYRIYREHPELIPVGWDGVPTPSRTLDYLNPVFLDEVRRWYAAVLPLIAQRTIGNGGNVIALQLDNEIGMLAWVTNSPDLTDDLLADLRSWCGHGTPMQPPATRWLWTTTRPGRQPSDHLVSSGPVPCGSTWGGSCATGSPGTWPRCAPWPKSSACATCRS